MLAGKTQGNIVQAIRDLSFEIPQGQAVGIIGRNGSGKSTLIKLLSQLAAPTSGSLRLNGRVQALLELGTAFHPNFSGRENLYFSASLAGLTRKEILQQEKAIIDFAELAEVIDRPLHTYSTGMRMRLAFSIATAVPCDILLLDEVLAVGDGFFTMRCYERMTAFHARGGTMLLVSHDLTSILRITQRTLWLEGGQLIRDGESRDVVRAYQDAIHLDEEERLRQLSTQTPTPNANNSSVGLNAVQTFGAAGNIQHVFKVGETLQVHCTLQVFTDIGDLHVALTIYRSDGVVAAQTFSSLDGNLGSTYSPGTYVAQITFASLPLGVGHYEMSVALIKDLNEKSSGRQNYYDVGNKKFHFSVVDTEHISVERGLVRVPVQWTLRKNQGSPLS